MGKKNARTSGSAGGAIQFAANPRTSMEKDYCACTATRDAASLPTLHWRGFESAIGTIRFLLDNFNRCPIVGQTVSRGNVGSKQGRAVTIAEFAPVRRETVMEMVARRIEALVRSGDLRSGSRLPPEPKLAAMLHVSRGSLREALKGLVFLGLGRARPGEGTYIQPSLSGVIRRHFKWMLLLQEIKYLELLELRQILGPAAAALA